MNNYIFSQQDPILFQHTSRSSYPSDEELRMQMERSWAQYQQMQQAQPPQTSQKDALGELDELLRHVNQPVSEILMHDAEYIELNNNIQQCIQEELMKTVRWSL